MTDAAADYRKYLDPRTLAKIGGLDLRARLIVEGLTAGQHRSPYQGISVEFAQHRPYVQGDDTRHVDWKVLGKTDKVYLKQYIEETNLHLIVVVDASQSIGFGTVKADDGTAVDQVRHAPPAMAAALSYLTIQQQDSVGLGHLRRPAEPVLQAEQLVRPSGGWSRRSCSRCPRWNKTNTGKVLDQLAEKLRHRSLDRAGQRLLRRRRTPENRPAAPAVQEARGDRLPDCSTRPRSRSRSTT